jgi:hypothetical protein
LAASWIGSPRRFEAIAPDAGARRSTQALPPTADPDSSIDYIFTDPPFGENIYYADLNFLVESWHGVTTDAKPEAIIDRFKKKALPEYQHLMQRCFAEYHRVLKPGRWMTVVFSNSRASVWNAIQVALQQAGFVVAEVTALDKQQGSYRQVTSTTAVKQDLVISAYKPNGGLEQRFAQRGATPESAWDFVQTHLKQLSVTKPKDGELDFIVERDPRRIYDRMVAWFVRHDAPVPLSSDEFLAGCAARLPGARRHGVPARASRRVRQEARADGPGAADGAVRLRRAQRDRLADGLPEEAPIDLPGGASRVHHPARRGLAKHEEKPELSALLEDNFLRYEGAGDVPSQITTTCRRTSTSIAAWTRTIRAWSPRPRNAGTSRTRTRQPTWRKSARRPAEGVRDLSRQSPRDAS